MTADHESVSELIDRLHTKCKRHGWWEPKPELMMLYFLSTKIALIHSEISEAFEALRRGLENPEMDTHLPQYPAFAVELADAVIRELDLIGATVKDIWGLDFMEVLMAKDAYNTDRSDHLPENRIKPGGKKF